LLQAVAIVANDGREAAVSCRLIAERSERHKGTCIVWICRIGPDNRARISPFHVLHKASTSRPTAPWLFLWRRDNRRTRDCVGAAAASSLPSRRQVDPAWRLESRLGVKFLDIR
jgi:hypothetical protein